MTQEAAHLCCYMKSPLSGLREEGKTAKEVVVISKAGVNDDLGQAFSRGDTEKWWDPRYILGLGVWLSGRCFPSPDFDHYTPPSKKTKKQDIFWKHN